MSRSHTLLRQVRALVFAGGGVRGLAFVGALQHLRDERGIDFGARAPAVRDVAGVSIGSVFALMIVLGYAVPEITEVGASLRYADMMNPNPVRIFNGELSIDDGTKLRAFVDGLLARKGYQADVTFSQLLTCTGMNMHVVVTDLTNASVVHLSASSHPHMPVAKAMVASMSLPLVFPPVTVDGHQWADGGVMENFPIMRFTPEEVLGFTFKWTMERKADTLLSYITRVLHVTQVPMEIASWKLTSRAHRNRSIVVDTGDMTTLSATVSASELAPETRALLLQAGGEAAARKLRQWDAGLEESLDAGFLLGGGRTLPTCLGSLETCHPREEALEAYRPR